jgi:tRNA uridine 5-carboxymethylaminomethyl modification enzyme
MSNATPHGSTWNHPDPAYDLIVIGAGHAGIEAALAGARMGLRTMIITMNLQSIGQMSCNPAIGGVGKGQLVREIDALGGAMGVLADLSGIQFRMLNRSKGPAVWSPRAQSDKWAYAREATNLLFAATGLDVRQGQVVDLLVRAGRVESVMLDNGTCLRGHAFVLCAGTFLNGMTHVGEAKMASGRAGEAPAIGLSQALLREGVQIRRYKTGTPPRVDRHSIRFDALDIQAGDEPPAPFRFYENRISLPQLPCHIAWTGDACHAILRDNLHRSPMYAGRIEGVGPRYCPSVEDKMVRFADKERHQLFLEPESVNGREMYVNGFSTSMPEDVQLAALRTVAGFEKVRFTRAGYAIEYDSFPAWQLKPNLSLKSLPNLFLAGQINGSSGYEEAAAQGLLAAIGASAFLDGREAWIPTRDQAYLGVLVDDLVHKPLPEPYRMFTSRAEFRLLLRQDNADERLMPQARKLGLLEEWRWQTLLQRRDLRQRLLSWLQNTALTPRQVAPLLENASSGEAASSTCSTQRAAIWLKRPEVSLAGLLASAGPTWALEADASLLAGLEMDIKYEGYIQRAQREQEVFRRNEALPLPENLDYSSVAGLSIEARDRLKLVQPGTMGQAARVGGVNPTDLQALWIHLQKGKTRAASALN